jgi:hypothetical protein
MSLFHFKPPFDFGRLPKNGVSVRDPVLRALADGPIGVVANLPGLGLSACRLFGPLHGGAGFAIQSKESAFRAPPKQTVSIVDDCSTQRSNRHESGKTEMQYQPR